MTLNEINLIKRFIRYDVKTGGLYWAESNGFKRKGTRAAENGKTLHLKGKKYSVSTIVQILSERAEDSVSLTVTVTPTKIVVMSRGVAEFTDRNEAARHLRSELERLGLNDNDSQ